MNALCQLFGCCISDRNSSSDSSSSSSLNSTDSGQKIREVSHLSISISDRSLLSPLIDPPNENYPKEVLEEVTDWTEKEPCIQTQEVLLTTKVTFHEERSVRRIPKCKELKQKNVNPEDAFWTKDNPRGSLANELHWSKGELGVIGNDLRKQLKPHVEYTGDYRDRVIRIKDLFRLEPILSRLEESSSEDDEKN